MAKYIDAEKLTSILNSKADMSIGTPKVVFDSVVKMVEKLPTADVVEVVRCKACKHASKCTDGYYTCRVDHRLAHDENDFCSYGERKTDNDI